jgi:hypothetical protein
VIVWSGSDKLGVMLGFDCGGGLYTRVNVWSGSDKLGVMLGLDCGGWERGSGVSGSLVKLFPVSSSLGMGEAGVSE